MKILISEGDFSSRLLLHKFFEQFGECHFALNCTELIEALKFALNRNETYELIIFDNALASPSAKDLIGELLTLKWGSTPAQTIRTIITSSDPSQVQLDPSFSSVSILKKPFNKDQLRLEMDQQGFRSDQKQKSVLIAEDDLTSRLMLEEVVASWGYEVIAVDDGEKAWEQLNKADGPKLAIVDWIMPKMDGIAICEKARSEFSGRPPYIILLTSRNKKNDIVTGLSSGASDYLSKPFESDELKARLEVGSRMLALQESLSTQICNLEFAIAHIKVLQGIIPICCYCHKIRSDKEGWERLEKYISSHTAAEFTHGVCPDCLEQYRKNHLSK